MARVTAEGRTETAANRVGKIFANRNAELQYSTLASMKPVDLLDGFVKLPGVGVNVDLGGLRGGVSEDIADGEDR